MGDMGDAVGSKRRSKKKASKDRDRARSDFEDESSKQLSLALSLALAGKTTEAKSIFLAVKESAPHLKNTSKMRHAEGLLCYYDGNIDAAILILEKVEAEEVVGEWLEKSKIMRDQLLLGNNLSKQQQSYLAALEAYDKCLELDPFNSAYMGKVYWRRALLHEAHSHLEKAEADLTAGIVLEPENLRVLAKRAAVRLELNQLDAALQDLEVLQGLQPSKDTSKKIEAVQKKKTIEEKRLKEEAEKKKAYEEMKEEREKKEKERRKTTFRGQRRERQRNERGAGSKEPTFYEILEVDESASASAIKAAFREKAKEFHPDRHSNAEPEERARVEERMKEVDAAHSYHHHHHHHHRRHHLHHHHYHSHHQVAAAHSCLSDADKREEYDRKLAGVGEHGGDFFFDFMFERRAGGRCNCRQCWN